MSSGTIWLVAGLGLVIGIIILGAVLEAAWRGPSKKSFADRFAGDPEELRRVHTTFGNPLADDTAAEARKRHNEVYKTPNGK